MRGTLIGSDYLKQDNGIKFLEINTNIAVHQEAAHWMETGSLMALLTGSNITEFHFIHNGNFSQTPQNEIIEYTFAGLISSSCASLNISFTHHEVAEGAITVPYIEDADHKFILRQSYDNTAIIDSSYAADNFGFFDLMSGSVYNPNSYFSSSLDELVLDSFSTLSYNDHPNAVVKSRYPSYDSNLYPQIHKFNNTSSTSTDVQQLKNSLPEDFLVQEFINDPQNIISGSWSVLRGIDILYGSNLDVLHLGGYATTSYVPLSLVPTTYSGSSTSILDRKSKMRYNSKAMNSTQQFYHTDEETVVLKTDGSLVSGSQLSVGDEVKTVLIDFEVGTEVSGSTLTTTDDFLDHYGYINDITGSIQIQTSSLSTVDKIDADRIFIDFTFTDNSTMSDSPRSSYLIEESGSNLTYFEYANKFIPGDKICYLDINTKEITTKEISTMEMSWGEPLDSIFNLDFEPYNYFLVNETGSKYAISHNICAYCYAPWAPCGNYYCDMSCPDCGGGFPGAK